MASLRCALTCRKPIVSCGSRSRPEAADVHAGSSTAASASHCPKLSCRRQGRTEGCERGELAEPGARQRTTHNARGAWEEGDCRWTEPAAVKLPWGCLLQLRRVRVKLVVAEEEDPHVTDGQRLRHHERAHEPRDERRGSTAAAAAAAPTCAAAWLVLVGEDKQPIEVIRLPPAAATGARARRGLPLRPNVACLPQHIGSW